MIRTLECILILLVSMTTIGGIVSCENSGGSGAEKSEEYPIPSATYKVIFPFKEPETLDEKYVYEHNDVVTYMNWVRAKGNIKLVKALSQAIGGDISALIDILDATTSDELTPYVAMEDIGIYNSAKSHYTQTYIPAEPVFYQKDNLGNLIPITRTGFEGIVLRKDSSPTPSPPTTCGKLFGPELKGHIEYAITTSDNCYLSISLVHRNDKLGLSISKLDLYGNELWRYELAEGRFRGIEELENNRYYLGVYAFDKSGGCGSIIINSSGKEERRTDCYNDPPLMENWFNCVTNDGCMAETYGGASNKVIVIKSSCGKSGWVEDYTEKNINDYCANFIRPTSDNGCIITGSAEHADSIPDLYLLKIDAMGNKEWGHVYDSERVEEGICVCEKRGGGYIVVGSSAELIEAHDYGWSSKLPSPLLLMVDEKGNEIKRKIYYEDTTFEEFQYICKAHDSGYIILGDANRYATGNPFIMIKIDEDGNCVSEF